MSIQQPTARHARTTTVQVDPRGPGRARPRHYEEDRGVAFLPALMVVATVLTGGWVAAQHWLVAQCPVTPELAQVCSAVLG